MEKDMRRFQPGFLTYEQFSKAFMGESEEKLREPEDSIFRSALSGNYEIPSP
jgi:hypothetical protein